MLVEVDVTSIDAGDCDVTSVVVVVVFVVVGMCAASLTPDNVTMKTTTENNVSFNRSETTQ